MAVSYSNIAGQEPSTITFRVGTVVVARGSTNEQQEILVIGDPETSNAIARVVAAAPDSTHFGAVVRQVGYVAPSTVVSVSTGSVRVHQSTAADLQATVAQASTVWAVQAAQDGPWTVSVSGYSTTVNVSSLAGKVQVVNSSAADLQATVTQASTVWAVQAAQDGPWTVRATLSSTSADNPVSAVGNVAHDAADSGNPVKIGGIAASADPTAVANADRVNALFDVIGRLVSAPYTIPENIVSGAITSAMTGTTPTSLVAAPGAGLRNYITTLIISNAHATVGTDVVVQDGSGGTTLLTIPAAAVYGGAVINLPVPLRQPTTNTALFCANVTTGASVKASAVGYKGI